VSWPWTCFYSIEERLLGVVLDLSVYAKVFMPLLGDFFIGDEVVTIERAIGLERPLPCIHRKKRPTLGANIHRGNPIISL